MIHRHNSPGRRATTGPQLPAGPAVRSLLIVAAAIGTSLFAAGVSAADEVVDPSPVAEVGAEPVLLDDLLKVEPAGHRETESLSFTTGTRIGQ